MLYLGESFLKYAHQHQTLITHKHENLITDGQEAHEKMLNITNYQKNANQNYKGGVTSEWPSSIYKQQMLERVWRNENPPTLLVEM